jgi:hypothetical protein
MANLEISQDRLRLGERFTVSSQRTLRIPAAQTMGLGAGGMMGRKSIPIHTASIPGIRTTTSMFSSTSFIAPSSPPLPVMRHHRRQSMPKPIPSPRRQSRREPIRYHCRVFGTTLERATYG